MAVISNADLDLIESAMCRHERYTLPVESIPLAVHVIVDVLPAESAAWQDLSNGMIAQVRIHRGLHPLSPTTIKNCGSVKELRTFLREQGL